MSCTSGTHIFFDKGMTKLMKRNNNGKLKRNDDEKKNR